MIAQETRNEIKQQYASGMYAMQELASRYSVSLPTVNKIIHEDVQNKKLTSEEKVWNKLKEAEKVRPGILDKLAKDEVSLADVLGSENIRPALKAAKSAVVKMQVAAKAFALFDDASSLNFVSISDKAIVKELRDEVKGIFVRYTKLFKGEEK